MYLVGTVAWVWLVLLGVVMLMPGANACVACGSSVNFTLALFSILLGMGGLMSRYITSFRADSLPHTH